MKKSGQSFSCKKLLFYLAVIILLAVQIWCLIKIRPDMSEIGKPPEKLESFMGIEIPMGGLNIVTLKITWIIMVFLVFVSYLATRRLKEVPGRLQALFEMLLEAFDKICADTLGDKGRIFMPYVTTLFLFVLLSNWIGIIPVPGIEEPTRDLNTTLALGLISFFVSHIAAIRYRGFKSYIASYFDPWIEIKGVKIPNIAFAPLNVVGELGKMVSHSFRLYGNILGGAIIIQVISNLTHYFLLPVGLNFFFGLFVGAVQAFVFSMLALTYIAVLVEE